MAITTIELCLIIGLFTLGTLAIVLPFVLTRYQVTDDMLIYQSGLRWGRVPVDRIGRITRRKASLFTINASCSYSGLRVQFHQGEIFIAPQDEESFIADLLQKNPRIEVEEEE